MDRIREAERIDTVVIGGGQAGLSVGYHLARRRVPFVILDASERVGDSWRGRWDSLRVFTPARYSALDGMPFPGDPHEFPTKDEVADYLEGYAARFRLPVRSGVRVERLYQQDGRFVVETGESRIHADQVVVAMGDFQKPKVPDFADRLDPAITHLHSSRYRNPSQLRDGPVLIVGAGNSGAEIAMELAPRRTVWLSGRDVGQIPFRIAGAFGRRLGVPLVLRFLFHRVLTVNTPIGRKARPGMLSMGGPRVRTRMKELAAAGVRCVPRMSGVQGGVPVLEDRRVLDVANVIWCTGYHPGFSEWIELPILDGEHPVHESGMVPGLPGIYFVGLFFLHAVSSEMIHGVGRDAERIAGAVAARRSRSAAQRPGASPTPSVSLRPGRPQKPGVPAGSTRAARRPA